MSNRELKNKIRLLHQLREMSNPRPEWLKANREILLMQIKNTTVPKPETNRLEFAWVWNFMDVFLPRALVHYAVKPVMVFALAFGLVFGGWITTVSASYNSLPGEMLYSVKLATENVQTSLASKPKESKLRTEFAARRVEEVKKIVKDNLPKKEQRVEEAVKHLKSDLETVKVNLEEMKKPADNKTSAVQAVEVAKAVNEKTTEIQKSLEQTTAQLIPAGPIAAATPMQEQVKQATAVAVETGVKAVEVIIEKHQEDKNSVTVAEVKTAVDDKLKVLEGKVSVVDQKIDIMVSTSTLTVAPGKKDAVVGLVAPAKETSAVAKETINQAKEDLSKENFNGALDKLKQGSVLTQAAEVKTEATQILVAPVVVNAGTSSSTVNNIDIKNNASGTIMVVPGVILVSVTSTLPSK